MFSKKSTSPFKTVTFRLTIRYVFLITVVSLVVFLLLYHSLALELRQRVDRDLLQKSLEIEGICLKYDGEVMKREVRRETGSHGSETLFILVFSPRHELVAASDLSTWEEIDVNRIPIDQVSMSEPMFETIDFPGHRYKIRTISRKIPDGRTLYLGFSLEDDANLIQKYKKIASICFLLMIVGGSLLGWFVANQAMSGVKRVAGSAIRIGKGELDHRVALKAEGEEIDNLAQAFNEMSDRIQTLVTKLKEATDDVAHELKSPITRIRGTVETTLLGRQDLEEYQEAAGIVIEECDNLVDMINTMLEITIAESGNAELSMQKVDMTDMVATAHELFLPIAEDKKIAFHLKTRAQPLRTMGDRGKLQRAIANILDNAMKYTPPGGEVILSIDSRYGDIVIAVVDSGIGIEEKDFSRIFDRFFRKDPSRSTSGSGLGLSLSLAIVRAHGGKIEVKSRPGKGSTFTITLPQTSPSDTPPASITKL
ncbi:MAG: HAMP domain-containing protein [Deltaproteobacteria bacterium]|nr:HAMP domain-containing protein [Deltaproteobacteria bacterium]